MNHFEKQKNTFKPSVYEFFFISMHERKKITSRNFPSLASGHTYQGLFFSVFQLKSLSSF